MSLFLQQLYSAAMAKPLEIALPVIIDYVIVIQNFPNPERHPNPTNASKHDHFTEGVDFAYWWSYWWSYWCDQQGD